MSQAHAGTTRCGSVPHRRRAARRRWRGRHAASPPRHGPQPRYAPTRLARHNGGSRRAVSRPSLRKSSWTMFNDFSHAGSRHFLRPDGETTTGPYAERELIRVIKPTRALGLLWAFEMALLGWHQSIGWRLPGRDYCTRRRCRRSHLAPCRRITLSLVGFSHPAKSAGRPAAGALRKGRSLRGSRSRSSCEDPHLQCAA